MIMEIAYFYDGGALGVNEDFDPNFSKPKNPYKSSFNAVVSFCGIFIFPCLNFFAKWGHFPSLLSSKRHPDLN